MFTLSASLLVILVNGLLPARPFIIDLESTNSTFVNDEAIPQARYYELKMGDGEIPVELLSAEIRFTNV